MPIFDALEQVAAAQHGLVTRQQLRRLGFSDRMIRTATGHGSIVSVARGIYRLAGAPANWEQQLLALQMAAGPLALASHRSAAGLWRLDRFRRQHFDLAVPAPASRRPVGATLHESNSLPARDRTVVTGIPTTTPTRTIVDVGRYLGVGRLCALLDDAVRRDLTSYEAVHRRVEELAGRGRDGIATVRRVLELRPVGAATPDSPLEDEARRVLVAAGLPEPVLHHRVVCDDLTYVLDLAWPQALVALECDGFRFHRTPEQLAWDDDRRNRLGLRGWLVLHTTSTRTRSHPDRMVADVRRALEQPR